MAAFLLLGALAGFALSERARYQVQDQDMTGSPVGEVRTVTVGRREKVFFVLLGAACMLGSLYFLANQGNRGK